jgi:very-short-patch-repair endonuclease
VARARALRQTMTRYEVKLWLRLRELKLQGFRFRRQVRLDRWVVDFACLSNRIVVEVDGMQHGFEAQRRSDIERDAHLSKAGFIVLRFSNSEVWENIDGVVATIFERRTRLKAVLADRSAGFVLPPPDPSLREGPPSPQGGGRKSMT